MGYLPSVRLKWLDIGQVHLGCLRIETESRFIRGSYKRVVFGETAGSRERQRVVTAGKMAPSCPL